MASITCKISYDGETRRFKIGKEDISYESLHARAASLFDFAAEAEFKLQYKDDEGDVITMSSDPEMREAVDLACHDCVNPILRLTVKTNKQTGVHQPVEAATQAEAPAAAAAATDAPPDLNEVLKNINQELPNILRSLPSGGGGEPNLPAIIKSVGDSLPSFVESLPKCVRDQMAHAEVDVAATLASNTAAKVADILSGKASDVSFSVLPTDGPGYGDKGVHPGVTCDKSGMCPIVGLRYNLKGYDYDLCEAEYNKLEPAEQAKFVKIEPPGRELAVHHGVSCDKSGMCPIVGPRYNLKGQNYDLCEAEYSKLEPAEAAKFVKIDAPMRQPWRPRCWGGPCHGRMGGHGYGSGNNGGFGGGGGGGGFCGGGGGFGGGGGHCGAKLAARFVTDVTIFDGTQMAPGTNFTKIWRIKNVGETPWPAGTKLLFVGGDRMAAELTVPLGDANKSVMPGEEVDVAVDMVAPPELGRYLGYWRLTGPLGRRRFGQRVWCHIQVVDPATSAAPADAKALDSEISQMMDKLSDGHKDDPYADDEGEADAVGMAPAPAVSCATSCSSAASSCASSASGLSSAVSSATSSAVSVSKPEAPNEAPPAPVPEKTVPEKMAEEAAPKEPTPVVDEAKKEGSAEAAAVGEGSIESSADVATQLLQMGFEGKSVELVMEKHAGVYPASNYLETCSRELLQLSEWDEMLSDLEEMGFDDREKNTRLMIKNDGSVKRTVKDLVADAA